MCMCVPRGAWRDSEATGALAGSPTHLLSPSNRCRFLYPAPCGFRHISHPVGASSPCVTCLLWAKPSARAPGGIGCQVMHEIVTGPCQVVFLAGDQRKALGLRDLGRPGTSGEKARSFLGLC